jgi:hypothetical protein
MKSTFPAIQIYSLSELEINLKNQVIEYNNALLNQLTTRTLTTIKKAFQRGVRVEDSGRCYVAVTELHNLLRTDNPGTSIYYVRNGIDGYASRSETHDLGGELYLSGPDFSGLLDARIHSTFGVQHLYLKYVRAVYQALTASPVIGELRNAFVSSIERKRSEMKGARIRAYNISACEFSGVTFTNTEEVQFAHIESVATSPTLALDIDNGVIILKHLHAELTSRHVHNFEGMYDYCINNGYSTIWAENYPL